MATQVQWRRGTHAQVLAFTGAIGEIVVDLTQSRLVLQDGVTPGGAPHALLSDVQGATPTWKTVGGTADAITLASTNPLAVLSAGTKAEFKAAGSSTSTAPTINLDSTGNKTVQQNGQPLVQNAIVSGSTYLIEYDGVYWQLVGASGGNIPNAINENYVPSVASAATVDIAAQSGNYLQITGTTTITSFGNSLGSIAGAVREIEFSGALTLTNSASLILPTGANIITVAGDVARFRYEGSGVWRGTSYQRASGAALAGNAPAPGGVTNVSSSTSITLTNISTQTQNVTMTAAGQSVTLPDVTTLGGTGFAFTITNAGSNPFCLRRWDGSLMTVLLPGGAVNLGVNSAATQRGGWNFDGQGFVPLNQTGIGAISAASTGQAPVMFSSNIMLVPYNGTLVSINLATSAVNVLVISASLQIEGLAVLSGTACCAVTVSSGVVAGYVITVAGSGALTLNSAQNGTLTGDNQAGYSFVALASSTVVLTFGANSGGNNVSAIAGFVSGTTITWGTIAVLGAGPYTAEVWGWNSSAAINSTTFVSTWADYTGATGFVRGTAATVSGNTITPGATLTLSTGTGSASTSPPNCVFQNGGVLCFFANPANSNAASAIGLTVSGTTITKGSISTSSIWTTTATVCLQFYPLSGSTVAVWQENITTAATNTGAVEVWSISGTSISQVSTTGQIASQIGAVYIDTVNSWVAAANFASLSLSTSGLVTGSYAANKFTSAGSASIGTIRPIGNSPMPGGTPQRGCYNKGGLLLTSSSTPYSGAANMINANGVAAGAFSLNANVLGNALVNTKCMGLANNFSLFNDAATPEAYLLEFAVP